MIRPMLSLAFVLATTAASAHFPIAQRLRQIDTNHDRALSLTEVLSARQARFVALDLDHDKLLTLAEISNKISSRQTDTKLAGANQGGLARIGERFSRLDKNHDTLITQAEWDGKVAELFARFDVNNDQLITRPEVRSVRQFRRAQR